MHKHPMLSVKEAASLLGCDERWIRERLNQGQLKGEKRFIGLKEKWFIYRGEIDAALARKGVAKAEDSIKPSFEESSDGTEYFGVDSSVEDVETIEIENASQTSITELVRVIANEFAEKLDQQRELNWQLKVELEEKERQLRLIPDLQVQAERERKEAELKALEAIALEKQIEEMKPMIGKVIDLEANVVPELQRQLESERTSNQETLDQLERERTEAESARRKVEELELAFERQEKNTQEQLAKLNEQLLKLQAPWWKKWFLPRDVE